MLTCDLCRRPIVETDTPDDVSGKPKPFTVASAKGWENRKLHAHKCVIEHCFKTVAGRSGQQRLFLIQYPGRISPVRLEKAAIALHTYWVSVGDGAVSTPDQALVWLSSKMYTQRCRNVTVTHKYNGNIDVDGDGWHIGNFPLGSLSVLYPAY